MVIKLMKHELRALFRVLLYLGIADLVVSAIGALLFYTSPEGFVGVFLIIIGIYFSLIVACVAVIWSIRQFYSSMFTGEGYMTFSLPVTPMQMLWAKLLSALIATFFGTLICIASCAMSIGSIFAATDPEVIDQISQVFGQYWAVLEQLMASDPLYFVEIALLIIVSIPMSMLFFYSVICVGQLFTKGRKGITFAIGIGMLFIVLPLLSNYCLDPILNAAANVSVHLSMWINILLDVGLEVGMFFLIRYIMLHRVNLIV